MCENSSVERVDPLKDQLPLTMTIYDPACGSGGMLTESQNFIEEKYPAVGAGRPVNNRR
jgi:type I restriction enzyme M protein